MSEEKSAKAGCTIKNRKCSACLAALGLRRGPVAVSDMDADAIRWRAGGAELVRRLRVTRGKAT